MILDFFLDKLTQENYPIIIEDKCLKKIGDPRGCSSCIDSCPKEAISLQKNKLIIDEDSCNQCGICKTTCPSKAINLKGIGEENIHRTIKDKKDIVFSCSLANSSGNMKLNCINAFEPELLAALFLTNKEKTFNFNLSKCENCRLNEMKYFIDNLKNAVDFVESLGLSPIYNVYYDNSIIDKLAEEPISRRDLFMRLKKETTNVATDILETVVNEGDFLHIRKVLLNATKDIDFEGVDNNRFFTSYDVEESCDGCGDCVAKCPHKALRIEIDESIQIYHNAGICHNCGLCMEVCSKKALKNTSFIKEDLYNEKMIKEIKLSTCKECNKKYILKEESDEICPVCEKKKILRRKLATY